MDIPVTAVVGRGPTPLAAFDDALVTAGIADRNLITLSSVLPPGSRIHRVNRIDHTPGCWGDRLYIVMAHATTAAPGDEAWAGIGWAHDHSGRGLLVEHHADSEDDLRHLITTSLSALCRNRGDIHLPERGIAVAGATSHGQPTCALAVAVFEAAPWHTNGGPAGD